MPLFEAANYLLAWTDQTFRSLDVDENEFINLIAELRPMFKHAFGRVDTNDNMAECIASRQNQYEVAWDNRLLSYLNSLLLRAEVEENLFPATPELLSGAAVDAGKELQSRATLASLETTVVAVYLGSVRALIQGNAN